MDNTLPNKGGRSGGKNKSTDASRAPPSRDVLISKKLSWLLRHGATSEGLELDSGGYANLDDVLKNKKLKGMKATFAEVREIVAENDKQRFGLKLREDSEDETSTDPTDWLIRANQGHSVKTVESEGLLEPVTDAAALGVVVHGTTHAAWMLIVESGGLKAMGRNHVHFASGLPETFKPLATDTESADPAAPVISGMRTSSTILIYLSLPKALAAGIRFWRSANGVILSEGDSEGKIGIEFFERVEDRTGEGVLVRDGKVVKEAPAAWASREKGKGRR